MYVKATVKSWNFQSKFFSYLYSDKSRLLVWHWSATPSLIGIAIPAGVLPVRVISNEPIVIQEARFDPE